jgi:hypothetical protein
MASKEALDFLATPGSATPMYLGSSDSGEVEIENSTMRAGLEAMNQEIDQSFKELAEENELAVYLTGGVSLLLSAGTVSYLLKAGSLMSSFLATVPIWKGFDPIAILVAPKKKIDEKTLPESVDHSDTISDQNAENMFSGKENQ